MYRLKKLSGVPNCQTQMAINIQYYKDVPKTVVKNKNKTRFQNVLLGRRLLAGSIKGT